MTTTEKAERRTLYVRRDVVNAAEIIAWAKGEGFATTMTAEQMHVTIAYSKVPIDWMQVGEAWSFGSKEGHVEVAPGGARIVEPLGDKGAVCLLFNSSDLSWRHMAIREAGASWDHPQYQPHITITYDAGKIDLDAVKPYRGKIVLGPEIFEEVKADWSANVVEKDAFSTAGMITKIDEDMRVVWGWANVYEEAGKAVVDSHGDTIDEKEVVRAAHAFVCNIRDGMVMHGTRKIGTIVESLVFSHDVQKALGIDLGKAGWFIGMKVDDADVWKSVKDGKYRAFSFGGKAMREAIDA